MIDRLYPSTDAASPKGTDAPHGKILSFTDAQGNTYTSDQSNKVASSPFGKAVIQDAETEAAGSIGRFGITPETESKVGDFLSTAAAVSKDLATGAYHEITEHPLEVAGAFVKGAGTAVLATTVIAGAAALAPEVAVAATVGMGVGAVVGLGYEGYQFAKHLGGWSEDAKAISNPTNFSSDEVAKAHADLKGVGADAALIGSGLAGAVIAAPLAAMEAGDAWEGMAANRATAGAAAKSGDSVFGTLANAVQRGDYEIQNINGVSVFMPKQPTVVDVINSAVSSGRYAPQTINGVTVLMPR
jgi:hypothetical protein